MPASIPAWTCATKTTPARASFRRRPSSRGRTAPLYGPLPMAPRGPAPPWRPCRRRPSAGVPLPRLSPRRRAARRRPPHGHLPRRPGVPLSDVPPSVSPSHVRTSCRRLPRGRASIPPLAFPSLPPSPSSPSPSLPLPYPSRAIWARVRSSAPFAQSARCTHRALPGAQFPKVRVRVLPTASGPAKYVQAAAAAVPCGLEGQTARLP